MGSKTEYGSCAKIQSGNSYVSATKYLHPYRGMDDKGVLATLGN